ncbi:transmembrane protease serine 3 [Sander vitreus]
MTKSFVKINPAANTAAADTSTPPTELKAEAPEQPDTSRIEVVSVTEEDLPTAETPNTLNVSPLGSFATNPQLENESAVLGLEELKEEAPEQADTSRIEVVSVTEEDLPTVETPNTLNVSPLGSFATSPQLENKSAKPEEPRPLAAPSLTMAITKVQPFMQGETFWKNRVLAHRLELLIASCLIAVVTLVLGIGLGVGLSCAGQFRCGSSPTCIRPSSQCDGEVHCDNGEDELGCVRLSGRSSVLQVQRGGVWRTVCSDGWNNWLGVSACKQLGYSRYVESFFVSLTSVEQDLQSNLVSINLNQAQLIKLQNATAFSKTECSSGKVTTLKCLECGSRPQYHTRIVGGNISKPGQFPWQVSLHFNSEHLCGGSIITSRWVLTAAHCVYGFAFPPMWAVLVGLTEQPFHGAQSLAVEQIIYHARYRPNRLDYDIALMKLATPLAFNGFVEPICLPNYGEEFEEGAVCWISGWGATEDEGETSVVLRSARVPLISTKTCNQPDVYQGFISSWMICAGYLEGGTDSCQGDSGGPLAYEDSSVWKLVGATSWGNGCALRNKPGVYTRITQALSWIRQQMEREEAHNSPTLSTDN